MVNGTPLVSWSCTVIVLVVTPLAATGLMAVTTLATGSTTNTGAPIWKTTSAVFNISVPLISALIVTVSSVAFVAVTVYVPSLLSTTVPNTASPVVVSVTVPPLTVNGAPVVSTN